MTNNHESKKINNKWNISILVLFILIASSLIWILSTNYIRELMEYNNIIHWYYKSYYLSKAWLEISLTQIQNNWVWFENTINTWDDIIKFNFLCKNCNLYTSISWNSNSFSLNTRTDTWCNNPISLNTWQSFILPLFKQINLGTNYDKLTNSPTYKNMADKLPNIKLKNPSSNKEITIWIIIMSWSDILQDWIFIKTWSTNNPNIITEFKNSFEAYWLDILIWLSNLSNEYKKHSSLLKSFIILWNTKELQTAINFCIDIQSTIWINNDIYLPTSTFYIKSIWKYWTKTISLESFLKQPIPDFLSHTYLWL